MIRKITAVAALTSAVVLGSTGIAGAAHRHVDNPSGCHAVGYQAGPNSGGRSHWNSNAGAQADENSPVQSSGPCEASDD